MIFNKNIGIASYGAYIPEYCITATEIERAQGKEGSGVAGSLGVRQKTVPAVDEDTITLSIAAGSQALDRLSDLAVEDIGCLFIGSESHPYAVKPSGTVTKEALGLSDQLATADLQFACKAGTQGLQIVSAYVASDIMTAGMAIGADTAQARPGDVLEFTAGAGAAAYVVGSTNILARIMATTSITSDTPDFWRRSTQHYPEHAGRFSGEPAYFNHVLEAATSLMTEANLTPQQLDYCIFHTPNAKFPKLAAKRLGFSPTQLALSLVVEKIGNTYAAASMLALAAVLDQAKANQKILMVSYGSGAGSDAFVLETTQALVARRKKWRNLLADQIKHLQPISYQTYHRNVTQGH